MQRSVCGLVHGPSSTWWCLMTQWHFCPGMALQTCSHDFIEWAEEGWQVPQPLLIPFDAGVKVNLDELGAGIVWPSSPRSHMTCCQLWEH